MISFLLDTNAFSELTRSKFGAVGRRVIDQGVGVCGVSVISAGEIYYGAEWKSGRRLRQRIDEALEYLAVLPFEPPADRIYGKIRADLRHNGTSIGPNDLLIAAHALALDVVLVTDNENEFSRIPDLRIENWLRG
ncbi:PIN domain-containing protein [Fulvimarina sp. MAC8]|uniref:PIN domain-containing protein n=1 Tax=Fulvimarina sp. MAC8 TaxID=3162874 RepID=UPI0032ECADD3